MRLTICLLIAVSAAAPRPLPPQQPPATVKFKRGISVVPDVPQSRDENAPVRLVSIKSSFDGDYRDLLHFKEIGLRNYSDTGARCVRLRWFATADLDRVERKKVYEQGELDLGCEVKLGARGRTNAVLPKPTFSLPGMIERWSAESPEVESFAITIGVGEVVFEDGTHWRAEPVGP